MQSTEFSAYQDELQTFDLLNGFSDSDLSDLCEAIELASFAVDDYLFREGDTSSEIYLVRSGKIAISRLAADGATQILSYVAAGHAVGELAAMDGSIRSASARAMMETEVFVLDFQRLPVNLMLLSRLVNNVTFSNLGKLREQKSAPAKTENSSPVPASELQQFNLFNGLSEAELATLVSRMKVEKLASGSCLFRENEHSSDIYFIRKGKVEICKQDQSGSDQVIASLDAGQEVGELVLLDGAPRSASARVAEAAELLVLNTQNLPRNMMLLSRLIGNVTLNSTQRLRQANSEHAHALERELNTMRLQNEFGHFFVYSVLLLATGTIINYSLNVYFPSFNIYSDAFGWGYLMVALIPTLLLIRAMKIPLNSIGITWKNWKKSVREGIIASLLLIVAFTLIIGGARYFKLIPDTPLQLKFLVTIPLYFAHAYLQELLFRGIIQSSVQRFLNDKSGVKSVLLSSFVFGLFHIHFGLAAIFTVGLSGLAFGAFYLRHNNLLGVTVFHVTAGTYALVVGAL